MKLPMAKCLGTKGAFWTSGGPLFVYIRGVFFQCNIPWSFLYTYFPVVWVMTKVKYTAVSCVECLELSEIDASISVVSLGPYVSV